MRCNLIIQINEVTIRDYTVIEDEGIGGLLTNYPEITLRYEDDDKTPGRTMMVLAAPDLSCLFQFLDFSEIPVRILT